jgi:hypothetical protein
MRKGIHYTLEPHEETFFDSMIGVSDWVIGYIEGIFMLCGEKKEKGDPINEIDILAAETDSRYLIYKKDTKMVGRVIYR